MRGESLFRKDRRVDSELPKKFRRPILLYGPPVDLETQGLVGGGAGGYARNMASYIRVLDIPGFYLRPVFHTIRKDYSLGVISKVLRLAVDFWRIVRGMWRIRPAAVHILAQYRDALPREMMVAALCSLFRIPYIYDIKGGMFVEAYERRGGLYRWGAGFIIKRAAGILGQGRVYVEFLEGRFGIAATYFPNFVPTVEVPANVPERFQRGKLKLLFVGLCHAEKGTPELLEACRLIAATGLRIQLTLIGDETEEFHAFANAFPQDDRLIIVRYGRQPHSAVLNAMQEHDLFCFPSRREGHSNALNEAMMSGLPIITTRSGFTADVLGEGAALYLEKGTPEEIAAAIKYVANNPDAAAERAHLAKIRFLENFTSDIASARLSHFYSEVLV